MKTKNKDMQIPTIKEQERSITIVVAGVLVMFFVMGLAMWWMRNSSV